MRIINYKITHLGPRSFKQSLKIIRKALLELSLYRWRFELVETNKTYQFRFYITKSKLSKVESSWLHKLYLSFINEVENN